MGSLILSEGGSAEQNARPHEFLVESMEKYRAILYIPLTGDPNYRSYYTSLDYIKSILEPLGVKEVTMWTDLYGRTLDELQSFSAIYFSGGSTFTLLNEIKNSGFDKILIRYLKAGGIIYGQSAGAIIFGSDVSHTPKEKDLTGYEPLNLIHNSRLWCHYDNTEDERLCAYSEDSNTPFIALPDGGAIHVTETYSQVISKKAYVFKGGKKTELI
ncbi:Type 1 glutamine amidotransferase-like domain-containing protein [Halobacillus litoralis]|uniref:Type 1 glutamine amidotransferase-like domain-containing protein n=1 Tax=Halobacillus litoralis TaxID=45668 RepID=UPI002493A7EF|nr:Type 1 glutamine amidotransferase-like domain-containing protein [Halobacillus litoralis]